jgi:restriction system protein
MAEVSGTRRGELVRGILQILLPHPDGLPAKLVLERLATVVPPTSFEQSAYPKQPDVRRYEKIARFSTIGPVKAGWLTKNKGGFQPSSDVYVSRPVILPALDRYVHL